MKMSAYNIIEHLLGINSAIDMNINWSINAAVHPLCLRWKWVYYDNMGYLLSKRHDTQAIMKPWIRSDSQHIVSDRKHIGNM